MQAACKDSIATGANAVDVLSQQYFFTSTKLAALATQAEILTKVCPPTRVLLIFWHAWQEAPASLFYKLCYLFILQDHTPSHLVYKLYNLLHAGHLFTLFPSHDAYATDTVCCA